MNSSDCCHRSLFRWFAPKRMQIELHNKEYSLLTGVGTYKSKQQYDEDCQKYTREGLDALRKNYLDVCEDGFYENVITIHSSFS